MAPKAKSTAKEARPAEEPSAWAKALTAGGGWDKTTWAEFPVAVYWVRQVVGLALGLLWGFMGFTGATALLGFGAASFVLGFLYYGKFAGADVEDFGGFELAKEGMMPSFGLFLVSWVVVYSAVYHPEV